MAEKTEAAQAKTTNSSMLDEYNKGASPDELAQKYNLTAEEVMAAVVKPADDPNAAPLPTQAELDEQEAKKGK